MLRCEICFGTTREICAFKSLKIEQKRSLWLYLPQHSGCARGLAYPFLWSHFFIFWSRWVGTGSQMYYSQVCQREKRVIASKKRCACGGWDKGTCNVAPTWLLDHQGLCFVWFCFDLLSALPGSHHLSTVLQWKFSHLNFSVWLLCDSVACSSFLCLTKFR